MLLDSSEAEVAEGKPQVRPCKGTNERGEPCSSPRMEGSEFCFFHNPAAAEKRDAAAKQVGPVQAQTPEDLLILLEQALTDCLALENSISRAKAVGYLAGVILKVQEVGEVRGRLAALEAQVSSRYG